VLEISICSHAVGAQNGGSDSSSFGDTPHLPLKASLQLWAAFAAFQLLATVAIDWHPAVLSTWHALAAFVFEIVPFRCAPEHRGVHRANSSVVGLALGVPVGPNVGAWLGA
jgi:hypothetical protein